MAFNILPLTPAEEAYNRYCHAEVQAACWSKWPSVYARQQECVQRRIMAKALRERTD